MPYTEFHSVGTVRFGKDVFVSSAKIGRRSLSHYRDSGYFEDNLTPKHAPEATL